MDCQACGYCERIAAQAVSISPEYRTRVLRKYAEMDAAMLTGRLWGV
jgi:glutaredoxin